MKIVVVASANPVKLDAVRRGFVSAFPEEMFEFLGVAVSSGVSDQPRSAAETLDGAMNRAVRASEAAPDADFWVGLEGGVEEHGHEMGECAWIVVRGRDGRMGRGRTGMFFLPEAIAALIRSGKELGEADDIVFGRTNSKQQNGTLGILTRDVIDRTSHYANAVILALVPFVHEILYPNSSTFDSRQMGRRG